jgi:hypothetical protein
MALVCLAAVKVDAGTQTPTHFTEKFMDVNYEWNEWALRRRVSGQGGVGQRAVAEWP